MKKSISIALALSLCLSFFPTNAFAVGAGVLSVDSPVEVTQEVTLTGEYTPNFIIEPDASYPQIFEFALVLNGSVWSSEYDVKGEIEGTNGGVTYSKTSDTRLNFKVDRTKYDMTKETLKIPLYSTLKEDGEITVQMDAKNNVIPSKKFTYATMADRAFLLAIDFAQDFEQEGNLGTITIRDQYSEGLKSNTKYTFSLDNGFIFTNTPDMKLDGKYENNVSFAIDSQDASKAILTIKNNTKSGDGEILLYNFTIRPQRDSYPDDIHLTLTRPDGSATIRVGRYITTSKSNLPVYIHSFEGGKFPRAEGTASSKKVLQVRIDGEEAGEITSANNGTWSYEFPYQSSWLKEGKHTFAIGYYTSTNERWSDVVTKDFEILPEKTTKTVEFVIGNDYYTFDGRKGYLDAPAYIDDYGRAMLPLRALTNTLGIQPEDVIWNGQTNTITIKKGETQVICTIGQKNLIVNGTVMQMDTQAVLKEGRTFLPLRPLLNAFGISDKDITWDKETKTATFETSDVDIINISLE